MEHVSRNTNNKENEHHYHSKDLEYTKEPFLSSSLAPELRTLNFTSYSQANLSQKSKMNSRYELKEDSHRGRVIDFERASEVKKSEVTSSSQVKNGYESSDHHDSSR